LPGVVRLGHDGLAERPSGRPSMGGPPDTVESRRKARGLRTPSPPHGGQGRHGAEAQEDRSEVVEGVLSWTEPEGNGGTGFTGGTATKWIAIAPEEEPGGSSW